MVMDPTLLAEPARSSDSAAWSAPVALEDASTPASTFRSSLPTLDRPGDWRRQRTGATATPHSERPAMSALSTALMTAIYPVTDISAAKSWYAEVFGVEPQQPLQRPQRRLDRRVGIGEMQLVQIDPVAAQVAQAAFDRDVG